MATLATPARPVDKDGEEITTRMDADDAIIACAKDGEEITARIPAVTLLLASSLLDACESAESLEDKTEPQLFVAESGVVDVVNVVSAPAAPILFPFPPWETAQAATPPGDAPVVTVRQQRSRTVALGLLAAAALSIMPLLGARPAAIKERAPTTYDTFHARSAAADETRCAAPRALRPAVFAAGGSVEGPRPRVEGARPVVVHTWTFARHPAVATAAVAPRRGIIHALPF